MKVHIATLGKATEHISVGLRGFSSVSKIYLLTSEEFIEGAKDLEDDLEDFGFLCEIETVDPFGMNDIVKKITDIADQHRADELFINITGGTNLMAGAATSSAFLIGATPYYVLNPEGETPVEDRIVKLPSTGPMYKELSDTRLELLKTLKNLQESNDKVSIDDIKEDMKSYPQKISYHINQSEEEGLITKQTKGRNKYVHLTKSGELQLRWSKGENKKS